MYEEYGWKYVLEKRSIRDNPTQLSRMYEEIRETSLLILYMYGIAIALSLS